MSTRKANFITLDALIEELGVDVVRYFFIMRGASSHLDFDFDLAKDESEKNPVYYLQYAHARIHSIMKKADEAGVVLSSIEKANLSLLSNPRELAILRALQELPETVLRSTQEIAPHRITNWARDFASLFHSFYHDCRIIGEDVDIELTEARLWLVEASRIGLAISLDLLGVSAPKEMWREDENGELNG